MLHQSEALEFRRLMSRDRPGRAGEQSGGISMGSVEALEPRRLLAGIAAGQWEIIHYDFFPAGDWNITRRGTLVVRGHDQADTISVSRADGKIVISQTDGPGPAFVNGVAELRVKRVLIEAGGGDDRIHVAVDLLKRVTVAGGAGDDVIDGNAGSLLVGGSGNDRLFVPAHPVFSVDTTDPNSPASREASLNTRLGFFGSATLLGGDGNDLLMAEKNEFVVGGRGRDAAVEHIRYLVTPATMPDAESDFGDHASGVEAFGVFQEPLL
jgi:hypothetical protein